MILERGANDCYVLSVPRGEANVQEIVRDFGWNLSTAASSAGEAVLFTHNKYAAIQYADYATPELLAEFAPALEQIEASWSKDSDAHIEVPPGQELWPFQRAGVSYCRERTHSSIGDQPGLGKTAQAICLGNDMQARRVLVICPANIRLQWSKAIRVWSTMLGRYTIYPILKSSHGVHPNAAWTICSYDLIRNETIFNQLKRLKYDLLILDEAHYLKSSDAGRSRSVFGDGGLIETAERTVGLTGTLLPNRPRECFTIARAFDYASIDYMSEDRFKERFNPSVKIEKVIYDDKGKPFLKQFKVERVGRMPELQNRLRSNFMVRRLKRQVLDQLPPVRYEIQHVEATGAIRKALEAEKMLDIDPENLKGVDAKVLGHVSVVRHQMGMAIAPLAANYIDMLFEGGEEKLFIVAWHKQVLDILEERLHEWGIVRIDGDTSMIRRQKNLDRFQNDPNVRGLLGNIQAIGTGVDGVQNACSHGVGVECSWTPGENDQVVARMERIGQKDGVLMEWLVAPGSFGEKILGSSIRKLKGIHAALDEEH